MSKYVRLQTFSKLKCFVIGLEASENYGEPLSFEVIRNDLTGLELKMQQGASISGVAVIEGTPDPKLREKLTKVILMTHAAGGEQTSDMASAFGGTGQIAADGTFKIGGVRPGKVQLMANTMMAEKGLVLTRTELNNAEVKEFQVSAGDRLSGVRLVFAYGAASVAGKVEIRGTLPPKVKLVVTAQREGATEDLFGGVHAEVDARGQFLLAGLVAGTYRLRLSNHHFAPGEQHVLLPEVEQTITVSGNGRQEVTLVLVCRRRENEAAIASSVAVDAGVHGVAVEFVGNTGTASNGDNFRASCQYGWTTDSARPDSTGRRRRRQKSPGQSP